VLQHIHEPRRAIGELARTLAPGGVLVAFDNDWETFTISLDDPELTERIRCSWRDSFAAGRIGHDLPRLFREDGLTRIHALPRTLVLDDLAVAEPVFDLPQLLARMQESGELTSNQVTGIWDEFAALARDGRFHLTYTGYLVWGKKPAK
jgi:SAM-dependent methyltransferase